MVRLTRLNHVPLVLNSDLIEHIESTPDTVITLTNGQKFMVLESSEEVVERIAEFRAAVAHRQLSSLSGAPSRPPSPGPGASMADPHSPENAQSPSGPDRK